jgi:multiple sugar transport system substrate-binding protein
MDFGDRAILRAVDIAALPHFDEGEPAFVYGGWNFMVSKFSTKKEEAIEFIRFALRPENQRKMYELAGYIPVCKSVYTDSTYIFANPDLEYYRYLMKYGVHRPYVENYTKISDVVSYYVKKAISNEMTVEAALDRATSLINTDQVLLK